MQNINLTIEEYKESRSLLKKRIRELSAKIAIAGAQKGREDSVVKQFHERRMKLYTQLWDIEYAIREMQEYCELTSGGLNFASCNKSHSIRDVTENAS